MRRTRLLFAVVFVIGMLAWPAVSAAAGGLTAQGGGRLAEPGAVPNIAMPPMVPGATVGLVNFEDAQAWHGATIRDETINHIYYAIDPAPGTDVWVNLDIPQGSTVARIDAFGYRGTVGTLDWTVWDVDTANGLEVSPANGLSASGGPGVIGKTFTSFTPATVATGHRWNVDLRNSSTTGPVGLVGVIYQYFPPTYTLTPITPVRVYDSRFDAAGKLLNGQKRIVNVKNAINPANGAVTVTDAIPQGAKAISFTVTLTGTVGSGNVAVLPGSATPVVTASTINWTAANLDIATGSMVTMGVGAFERQVCLALGGSATAASHVIIDVTGYYM